MAPTRVYRDRASREPNVTLEHRKPEAFLSHASAAAVWGLRRLPTDGVDVTIVGRRGRIHPALRIHTAPTLDPHDRRLRVGLPVTAPAPALLDIAPTLTNRELERAFDEAL